MLDGQPRVHRMLLYSKSVLLEKSSQHHYGGLHLFSERQGCGARGEYGTHLHTVGEALVIWLSPSLLVATSFMPAGDSRLCDGRTGLLTPLNAASEAGT